MVQTSHANENPGNRRIAFFKFTSMEFGGGLEKFLIETAVNFSSRYDVSIDVITMDDSYTKRIVDLYSILYMSKRDVKDNFKVKFEDIEQQLGVSKYYKATSFKDLRQKLQSYDVIYSKNEVLEAYMWKFLIGYSNVPPIIFGCHTPIYYPYTSSYVSKLHNLLYNNWPYRFLCNGVSKFHVLNSSDRNALTRMFPNKQVKLIPNPFDFEKYAIQAKRQRYEINGLKKEACKILWAGRLTEQKGVDDLVSIIDQFNQKQNERDVIWVIAGEGPEKAKILSLIDRWKNVVYLGHVDTTNMPSVYDQSDLFISTSKWEGFPYALLEAQALGLPIIAYDIPGCADIVEDGTNGRLVTVSKNYSMILSEFLEEKYSKQYIYSYIYHKFNSECIQKELLKTMVEQA